MKHRPTSRRRRTIRSVLRLPDLEHAKAAVLNSLTSPDVEPSESEAAGGCTDRQGLQAELEQSESWQKVGKWILERHCANRQN